MSSSMSGERIHSLLERFREHSAGFDEIAARRATSQLRPAIPADREPAGKLSARELEVLELTSDGRTNREIGRLLFVQEDTVKTHLINIRGKLRARNRAHAVAIGYRHGLLRDAHDARAA